MTVGELKEALEGLDDDVEVHLAFQPNYPLEFECGQAVVVDLNEPDEDDYPEKDMDGSPFEVPEWEPKQVLYLSEGSSLDYLSGKVSRELGWK